MSSRGGITKASVGSLTLGLGLIPGAYVGLMVALKVAALNFLWESPRDIPLVIFWLMLVFGALATLVALVMALVARALRKSMGWSVFSVATAVAAVLIFIDRFGTCYACHQFLDWRAPHLIYTPLKSFLMALALGGACLGIGAAIGGIAFVGWRRWQSRGFRLTVWLVIVISIGFGFFGSYLSTPGRGEAPAAGLPDLNPGGGVDHLILIVDDAATWAVVNDLMEHGGLPAFSQMVTNGASGYLETLRPTHSPQIWTTMATGRSPARHAITGFINYAFPGMRYGIANFEIPFEWMLENICLRLHARGIGGARTLGPERRRVKALWNIATDAGLPVGVVNYHNTLPVEKINGFMLSNYFYLSLDKRPEDCVFPKDLLETVRQLMARGADSTFDWVTGFTEDEMPKQGVVKERIDLVRQVSNGDFTANLVAFALFRSFAPKLMIMGLKGLDTVGHTTYWEYSLYHFPDKYHLNSYLSKFTSEDLVGRLGRVIDNLYTLHDRFYRGWIEQFGPNDALIIVSDHGFEMNGNQHEFGPSGIVILYGAPFKKNYRLSGASVYDIAPTVLYLLGLPVGGDMEGKVLTDAIDPEWLRTHPVRKIDTYETVRRKPSQIPRKISEDALKRLRAVGYIR